MFLDFGPGSPVAARLPSAPVRLLVTGLLFAGTGSLVALSPIGRLSGAHLNPAVTLAFFAQPKVHRHDVLGYITAQILGAVSATEVLRPLWRGSALNLGMGAIHPGHRLSTAGAAVTDATMTGALVLVILVMTSQVRTARWTPLARWFLVATLVWRVAPYTGTRLKPARARGPDAVAARYGNLWFYLVGRVVGALTAVALFRVLRRPTLTAKLSTTRGTPPR